MPQDGLYEAWYCPFAQRTWIAVLYRGLDIDVHEANQEDLKKKTPQWLAISPRGVVPALVHNGQSIYESSLILEYLDDAWPAQPGAPRIFPSDPYQRFQARLWHEHIDKKLMVPFYQLLKCKDPEEQTKMKEQLLEDLKYMFDKKPSDSSFYLGDEPGYVDFMLVPFVIRYKNVLKQLRNFEIPAAGFEKFHGWYAKMMALDCVKKTLCDDQKLTDLYEEYYTN